MSTGSVQIMSNTVPSTKGNKDAGSHNQQNGKVTGFQLLLNQLGMTNHRQDSTRDVSGSDAKTLVKKVKAESDKTLDDVMVNLLSLLQSLQQKLNTFSHVSTSSDDPQKSMALQSLRDVLGSISTQLHELKGKQVMNDSFNTLPSRLQDIQKYVKSIQSLAQTLQIQQTQQSNPEQATLTHQVNLVMQSIQDWMSLGQNSTKVSAEFGIRFFDDNLPKDDSEVSSDGVSQKNPTFASTLSMGDLLNRKSSSQMVTDSHSTSSNDIQTRLSFANEKPIVLQKSTDNGESESNHGNDQVPIDMSITSLMGSNGQVQTGTQTDIKIPAESFAQQFGHLLDSKGLTTQNAMLQSNANGQEFRIKLLPEGMGEIHVLIQAKDAGLSVQFAASSEQARQMLDAQSAQLREQLSARGIQLDQVQVTNLSNTLSFAFAQSDQQNRNWGSQQHKSKRIISEVDEPDSGFGSYISRSDIMSGQSNLFESNQKSVIDTTA